MGREPGAGERLQQVKLCMLKINSLIIGGIVALGLFSGCGTSEEAYKSDVPVTPVGNFTEGPREESENDTKFSINLDVPFFSQAPTGNWGMPYQEACEEASLLLAYYYVTGQSPSIEQFEVDELAMVDWEVETFGQYEHTTIEQTAQIARDYLGYDRWLILDDPTVENLKWYLTQGYPIVAPMAGRYLGNPYFTGEGPVYHMLIIRGYDESEGVFITNDVGTRRGENFIYSYNVLMNALHDWDDAARTDPEGILKGDKRVLVLIPETK